MIKRILIEKLFSRFNYDISINQGITIITGPNGFGKSTILRIVNAISKGNINFFRKLDFYNITIEFDKSEKLTIKKRDKQLYVDKYLFPEVSERHFEYLQYRSRPPYFVKTPNGYLNRRTGENLTEDEFFYSLLFDDSEYLEAFLGRQSRETLQKIKSKLDRVKELCGDVRFISDQRLIKTQARRDEVMVVDVIGELPEKLIEEISRVVGKYSEVSNALDSSYPKRLFSAKDGLKGQEEYSVRLEEANKKFEKLNEYNLVDMSLIDEKIFNPNYSTALKIYFDDFAQKYKVFEDLISKLELFTKIINSRLTFKRIRITRTNGFEVVDTENPSKVLELSQLSSGEKQEIVLFYDLIFGTKENLLLLIDEPEISLHIMWQKQFLNDLMEVSKKNQLQVIVATHSPQIISNHMDIQIDLGGLYNEELNKR